MEASLRKLKKLFCFLLGLPWAFEVAFKGLHPIADCQGRWHLWTDISKSNILIKCQRQLNVEIKRGEKEILLNKENWIKATSLRYSALSLFYMSFQNLVPGMAFLPYQLLSTGFSRFRDLPCRYQGLSWKMWEEVAELSQTMDDFPPLILFGKVFQCSENSWVESMR